MPQVQVAVLEPCEGQMTPPWNPAQILGGVFRRREEMLDNAKPATGYQEINTWVDTPSTEGDTLVVTTTTTDGIAVRTGSDPVESPSHYCRGGFELGEILYVWGLSHRRASAVEYIMRAGDKDPAKEREDIQKAIRNLQMELDYMDRFGGMTR